MQVTYIHHSSFLVETASCTLLFDYFRGELPVIPADKPLYLLASHAHPDHFSKKLFDVAETALGRGCPDLRILLSDDIPGAMVPDLWESRTHFIAPHRSFRDPFVNVETLASNDAGIAFVIDVADGDGGIRHIYHAGDLNNWYWDGDEEDKAMERMYHEELARIDGRYFDAAFIPVDPRLGDDFYKGITDFVSHCDADAFFPMHLWEDAGIIARLLDMPEAEGFRDRVVDVLKLPSVAVGSTDITITE